MYNSSHKVFVLFLALFSYFGVSSSERVECVHRSFGYGGTVCVCNATYCDTVEPPGVFAPRTYLVYTSSKDGQRLNVTKKNLGTRLKSRGVVSTINTNITYQTIQGWGGAFTDSAGYNIQNLSPDAQEKLLASYFSSEGSEYTIGRVPIGGSDFSVRPYTYNDDPNDLSLSTFNLTSEDHQWKIPYIKKALEMRNNSMRLMAASWSAPPWMKTNNDYRGFGFLKEDNYQAWANYHIKFLDEYDKQGLKFWLLSTGNEPLNGAIPFFHFNCLGWTPSSQKTWIKDNLGPTLRGSVHNQTKLLILDDQRFLLPWWIIPMLSDAEVNNDVDAIGLHWYWDNTVPAGLLDRTNALYPTKSIIYTEACFVPKVWETAVVNLGSWSRGETYLENIIDNVNHWVTGWVDWNLALDPDGGPNWAENFVDAAIIVNKTSDEFYKQPMYYAVTHFSKFVPPGSVRVHMELSDSRIKGIAFKTPDEVVVIVALNKRSVDVPLSIEGSPRGFINHVLPRKSFTTILYRDKKPPMYKL